MPIQFRCGNCRQLLGIARRKAGAVVACPTCGGKTIVPRTGDAAGAEEGKDAKKGAAQAGGKKNHAQYSLLERVDVEKLLSTPAGHPSPGGAGSKSAMVDPAEMKALSPKSAAPKAESIPLIEVDDDDDVPLALSDMAQVQTLFSVTPLRAGLFIACFLLCVAGSFLLGLWMGTMK